MAYPTTQNWKETEPFLGASPFGQQYNAGTAPASLTVDSTQRHPLGLEIDAVDPVRGYGRFKYLQGVANTAAGDLVIFDPKAGTTTRTVAASRGPVAVAMAAVGANQFGWYAMSGVVPVSTTAAGTGAARAGLSVTATAGQGTVSAGAGAAGDIQGAICKSTQDAPGVGFTDVLLNYPSIGT